MWLSADHLSPYRFYQGWMQVDDAEVRKLLLQLTFLDLDQVDEVVADHEDAPHRRTGQRRIATELTTIVHGPDATAAAQAASEVMFGGSVAEIDEATFEMLAEEIPTSAHDRSDLDDDANLVPLLVAAGAASSKSEAGRLLAQNGISVNDTKVSADVAIDRSMLAHDRYCVVRKGKKSVFLLTFGQ